MLKEEEMENIAYINGEAAMAYQNEMPWHKLGTKMIEADVEVALKTGHLDWIVGLEPIFLADGARVTGRFANVRDVDRKVLGIVGKEYEPLQNAEAFGVLQDACSEFGVTIESCGALGIGAKCWMLAKLPDSVEPVPGDRVDGYFLVTTGHNGSIPFTARPTPIRVVCENTLNVAEHSTNAIITMKHIRSELATMDQVKRLINKLVKALKISGETFAQLAAKKMNRIAVTEYVNAVLGVSDEELFIQQYLGIKRETAQIKKRDKVVNLVWNGKGAELAGAKNNDANAWAAYNAVTEFVDHVRTAKKSEKAIRMSNKSALFGAGFRIKQRALQLALAA